MNRAETLNAAAFAGMVVVWGTTFLAIRVSNDAGYDPLSAIVLRQAAAAAILLGAALAVRAAWPRGVALRACAVSGLLIFGINFPMLYLGELTVTSGTAAVLWGIYPAFVALGAAVVLRSSEPLTARGLGGVLLGLVGLAVVFWSQLSLDAPLWGLAAILAGILVSTATTLILKRWARDAHPVVFNGLGHALGAAVLAPIVLATRGRIDLPPNAEAWSALLYLLVAGSLVAFPVWNWLLRRWPATRVSLQTLLSPLIAVALGAAVLHEALEARFLLGAALVLAGTWLTLQASPRPGRAEPPTTAPR